jgi:hypothetical protein
MSKQNNIRSLQGPFTSRSPVFGVLLGSLPGKPGMPGMVPGSSPGLPPEAADPNDLVLLLLDVAALLPAVPLLAAVEALGPAVFEARGLRYPTVQQSRCWVRQRAGSGWLGDRCSSSARPCAGRLRPRRCEHAQHSLAHALPLHVQDAAACE